MKTIYDINEFDEPPLCFCKMHYIGSPCPTGEEKVEELDMHRSCEDLRYRATRQHIDDLKSWSKTIILLSFFLAVFLYANIRLQNIPATAVFGVVLGLNVHKYLRIRARLKVLQSSLE